MKIRALRTFSAFDGAEIQVFNAGKNGEPGEIVEVTDKFGAECLATGHAEEIDPIPQLDHDHDGAPGGSTSATGDDIAALRADYREALGKAPFNGWDADELRKRIDARLAEPAADAAEEAPPA